MTQSTSLKIDQNALLNQVDDIDRQAATRRSEIRTGAGFLHTEATCLRRLLMLIIDQLGSSERIVPLGAGRVGAIRHRVVPVCQPTRGKSFARSGAMGTAPRQVRRAEEYIEAHWDQPITVEALAAATGAGAPSIFHFFKASRVYGPMVFVKRVRLRHARRMLMMPDKSVTSLACDCGFANLGHFAKDYGKCFGEVPSETLNRTKGASVRPTRRPRGGTL